MDIWEELADIKNRIPKDFRPWRVDNNYNRYSGEHWMDIDTTYYKPSDLGWLDEPMSIYRPYGVYSSKEKAIAAAKEYRPSYKIYCDGKLI